MDAHGGCAVDMVGAAYAGLQRGDERPGGSLLVQFEAAAASDAYAVGADLRGACEQRPVEGDRDPWGEVSPVGRVRQHQHVVVVDVGEHGLQQAGPAGRFQVAEFHQHDLCGDAVEWHVGGARPGDQYTAATLGDGFVGSRGEHAVTYRYQGEHRPSAYGPSVDPAQSRRIEDPVDQFGRVSLHEAVIQVVAVVSYEHPVHDRVTDGCTRADDVVDRGRPGGRRPGDGRLDRPPFVERGGGRREGTVLDHRGHVEALERFVRRTGQREDDDELH